MSWTELNYYLNSVLHYLYRNFYSNNKRGARLFDDQTCEFNGELSMTSLDFTACQSEVSPLRNWTFIIIKSGWWFVTCFICPYIGHNIQ